MESDVRPPSPETTAPDLPLCDDVLQILNAEDLKYVTVAVPEWKTAIRLRSLSADLASQFVDEMFEEVTDEKGKVTRKRKGSQVTVLSTIIGLCAVKADGSRLFTDPDQIRLLSSKNANAVATVANAAMTLNGMTDEAKEVAKNDSGGTDTSGTSSASPDSSAKPAEN